MSAPSPLSFEDKAAEIFELIRQEAERACLDREANHLLLEQMAGALSGIEKMLNRLDRGEAVATVERSATGVAADARKALYNLTALVARLSGARTHKAPELHYPLLHCRGPQGEALKDV